MNNSLNKKIDEINNEEKIWIIYLAIILLSFYSNYLEKDYFINNNLHSKEKYQNTLIIIFTILVIIYLYFLYNSYQDIVNIPWNSESNLKYLSFIASLLIFVSGIIYLYIAIKDNNIDVELAFN